MLHLPLLRAGRPYRSADAAVLAHAATGEPVAEVSQANPGLVARDLAAARPRQRALAAVPAAELVAIAGRAARLFLEAELPAGDDGQSPGDYLRQLAATTGMPESLGRANMDKIATVLGDMATVVAGLTRGLDPQALDRGWTVEDGGRPVAYRRESDVLGAVLPGNSPGVHGVWIPSIALKVPVALKPGSREPWTPYRVAQALLAAGCPPAAVGFYPGGHAVGTELLMGAGRSLLFGDRRTVGAWADDPRVQLHGPGWSKVVVGADRAAAWRDHLDLMVASVAANGGRSCVNASGVWVAAADGGRTAAAVAEALAARLAAIPARPLDDPAAELAAFPEPETARRISDWLHRQLAVPGAEDVTARLRPGGPAGRVAEVDGLTFLLPTVVHCTDPAHPLAQTELLFPFVSVVAVTPEELGSRIGASLVVTALSEDPALIHELLDHPAVDRLNLGPIPTHQVVWDQPHEGNLFAHLYRRRALQGLEVAAAAAAAVPPRSERPAQPGAAG